MAAPTTPTTELHPWQAAVEQFIRQMVFVLESEGREGFDRLKMGRWLDTCTERMLATGSVEERTVIALRAMQGRVLQ